MNERIRELIKALNMKQAEFAKRIGVSRPFVSELCSGNKKPSDRTVADICREFNVNEQWLRTGEGDMFLCIELVAKYAGRIGGEMDARNDLAGREKQKDGETGSRGSCRGKGYLLRRPGHSAGRLGLSGRYGLRGWRRVTASARCGSMDVLSARAARLTTAQAG